MKKPKATFTTIACVLVCGATNVRATDSVTFNPATGNYELSYVCDDERGTVTTTLEPHNKVAPAIESGFVSTSDGIAYTYSVLLGDASRQPLRMIALDPVQQVWGIAPPPSKAMLKGASPDELRRFQEAIVANAPPGWRTINFTNRNGTARVGWARVEPPPSTFVAKSRQDGFAFASRHLPGVFPALFRGDGASWSLPCEGPGPGPAADAVETLIRNDMLPRFVAAPVIRVDHPFSPLRVLKALRDHLSQLEQWTLIDTVMSTRIRGYLTEAIAKTEVNDPAGAAAALGKVRLALRAKYPAMGAETIAHALPPSVLPLNPVDDLRKLVNDYDRVLAARVPDFDASYVVGQLGPVAAPPPANYDCRTPAVDEICAPVADPDGTFTVRWGEKSCPRASGVNGTLNGCEITQISYRLEGSRDSNFLRSTLLYEGASREFQVTNFAPGIHYFRVTADYLYCVPALQGYGSYPGYCEEQSRPASDTYSKGQNTTTVDAR